MVFTYITWRQRFVNIHNVTLQRRQKDWKYRSESKVLVARNLEQYFRNARTGTLREWIPGNAYSLVWNLTHHYNDVIMSAMVKNVPIWWRHHVQYWRRHLSAFRYRAFMYFWSTLYRNGQEIYRLSINRTFWQWRLWVDSFFMYGLLVYQTMSNIWQEHAACSLVTIVLWYTCIIENDRYTLIYRLYIGIYIYMHKQRQRA